MEDAYDEIPRERKSHPHTSVPLFVGYVHTYLKTWT